MMEDKPTGPFTEAQRQWVEGSVNPTGIVDRRVAAAGARTIADAPIDPWQHRAEHMRRKTCMWFAPKQHDVGRCRRHAPTMNGYPVVMLTDWCGDHKLNEAVKR